MATSSEGLREMRLYFGSEQGRRKEVVGECRIFGKRGHWVRRSSKPLVARRKAESRSVRDREEVHKEILRARQVEEDMLFEWDMTRL